MGKEQSKAVIHVVGVLGENGLFVVGVTKVLESVRKGTSD